MYERLCGINSSSRAPGSAMLSLKQVSTFVPESLMALGEGRRGDLRVFQRKKEEKTSVAVPVSP